jgi:hypothetical protein
MRRWSELWRLGTHGTCCLVLPLWLLLAPASRPAVVGQLLNVSGGVEVQRGGEAARKGTLLYQLRQGDLLKVRGGGSAEVVLFRNGARFVLSGAASARVGDGDLKPVSGAAPRALKSLSSRFAKRINSPGGSVSPRFLGVLVREKGDPDLGPRDPSPSGAIRGVPVLLRWKGPVEGESLRVQISDGEQVVHRKELPPTAREYQVDPGILRRGEYYVWSVTAVSQGESGARCRAMLRLLSPDEQAELEQLEREAAEARGASPDSPASTLILAQVYERLGLFDSARAAYQEAERIRPGDAGVQAALKRLREGPPVSVQR